MAKHGHDNTLKRLNISRVILLPKKGKTWLIKPNAGTHSASESIALGSLLRDLLNVAHTRKEAKYIITQGKVLVDGKVVKDIKFPIGFMDVVHIKGMNMTYYIDLDSKGRLVPKRNYNLKHKFLKVVGKRKVSKGRMQYSFDDGRSMLLDKELNMGDVVKFSIPDFKVLKVFPLKDGSKCKVLKGKHAGDVGAVESIIAGTPQARAKAVVVSDAGEKFVTLKEYLFVLGE